jgi:hypothetical protein
MSGEDYCCEGCFEHPWLRATVRENPSLRGDCFYCGTRGWLAPVRTLGLGFRNLLSDYIPADGANGERDSFFPSESPLQSNTTRLEGVLSPVYVETFDMFSAGSVQRRTTPESLRRFL